MIRLPAALTHQLAETRRQCADVRTQMSALAAGATNRDELVERARQLAELERKIEETIGVTE